MLYVCKEQTNVMFLSPAVCAVNIDGYLLSLQFQKDILIRF